MSWLTDFTSKAESLLNKIDQSAADKIHELEETTSLNLNGSFTTENEVEKTEIAIPPDISNTTADVRSSSPSLSEKSLITQKSVLSIQNAPLVTKSQSADGRLLKKHEFDNQSDSTPTKKKTLSKSQDEMLFEFLNTTNSDNTKRKTSHEPPVDTRKISDTALNLESEPVVTNGIDLHPPQTNGHAPLKASHMEVNINEVVMKDNTAEDMVSHLELENQLLKKEVQSLNEELSRALTQVKQQMDETAKYKQRYENRKTQQSEDYDKMQKGYEDQLTDMKEALGAKDSQLAVLRVRMQETDNEIKVKSQTLLDVQADNERLMKDHTDASGVQNFALDNMRNQLEEAENHLSKEKLENTNMKSELMTIQEKLSTEQAAYADTIKQLEVKHSSEKEKLRDYEVKVKHAVDDAEVAKRDLNDYKEKAGRILQAKEKLISSLKEGKSADMPSIIGTELEEVKHERDIVAEEFTEYKYKMEQMRAEFQELEQLHNTTIEDNQQAVESLHLSLQSESSKSQQLDDDLQRCNQELLVSNDELHKLRKLQLVQNQQHEEEMKKLQSKLMVKQHSSSSQEELENRIRTLTDSLIQKQTVVEALSTEKNSLVLQLERLEKQYYDVQNSLDLRKRQKGDCEIDDLDSAGRQESIQSIMPQQLLRNQRWKTTANELDKFSVRFGVFLRRYPVARLMVFFYMLILHLWVTFVLLTYTPEIHPHEPPHT